MTRANNVRAARAAILGAVLILPLLGAWMAGRDLASFFVFPPSLAIPRDYPRFSWRAVGLVVAPFVALAAAWTIQRTSRTESRVDRPDSVAHRAKPVEGAELIRAAAARPVRFPWWGWVALGWTLGGWVLAWTRFGWFASWQRETFFPLWLGFIVIVNALTFSRTGSCAMQRPRRWLGLFIASAAFWWVFEWLNRFTQNWHYLGVADLGAVGYGLRATLCFSTVLPAVSAVREWLGTHARWNAACADGLPLRWLARPVTGIVLILGAVAALVGTGAAPILFYPALWAAPLALLLGEAILARREGIVAELTNGDWREAASWAIAALVCGGFWELWNFHSAAKWIYTVPFVERAFVFEMPLLGYLGYLPFGLECYFVVASLFGRDERRSPSSVSST